MKKNNPNKTKIFVGMSGGVDSSVAAALLKQAGYEVTGVFIKVWDPSNDQPDRFNGICTWREDRREAMRVAAILNIPLITLDLEKEYKRSVIDYMIAEYRAGRTPNPDVMCNKTIKFGEFYRRARAIGADFVATGHYAIIKKIKKNSVTHFSLLTACSDKDQSYFLWNLTEDQLKHTLFPIGHLTKPEVRRLAKKFKLPNADKPDSQGLCFIGRFDMTEFLKNYLKVKPGLVLNLKNEIIGRHQGAWFYTIGQRHGFIITKKTPTDKPYYIIAKNMAKNTITVSVNPKQSVKDNKIVRLEKVNWISFTPTAGKKYGARIRYRQKLKSCRLEKLAKTGRSTNSGWQAIFIKNQTALPAGQSLVVYDGNVCLGGGVIRK